MPDTPTIVGRNVRTVGGVVRVHPETGERALFVSPGFVSHILDVTPRESRALQQLLYEQLTRPEYTVRFRWEPGSVAFWDNRATAHLAPNDLDHLDVARRLHRVTLIGDVPVGGHRSGAGASAPSLTTSGDQALRTRRTSRYISQPRQ